MIAMGMGDVTGCGGVFGIPVVDTTGGSFRVYYFPINDHFKDYYDETIACIKSKGVSGCYDMAIKWADVKL